MANDIRIRKALVWGIGSVVATGVVIAGLFSARSYLVSNVERRQQEQRQLNRLLAYDSEKGSYQPFDHYADWEGNRDGVTSTVEKENLLRTYASNSTIKELGGSYIPYIPYSVQKRIASSYEGLNEISPR